MESYKHNMIWKWSSTCPNVFWDVRTSWHKVCPGPKPTLWRLQMYESGTKWNCVDYVAVLGVQIMIFCDQLLEVRCRHFRWLHLEKNLLKKALKWKIPFQGIDAIWGLKSPLVCGEHNIILHVDKAYTLQNSLQGSQPKASTFHPLKQQSQ